MTVRYPALLASAAAALLILAALPPAGVSEVLPPTLDERRAEALDAALAYVQRTLDGQDNASPLLVEALLAAGLDPAHWPERGAGPLDRLQIPRDLLETSGMRAVHAVAASGYDPYNHPDPDGAGARDLIAELRATLPAVHETPGIGDDAFALLALLRAGVPLDDPDVLATADSLLGRQRNNGGWSCHGPPTVDCTGFVLAALAAADALPDAAAEDARAFLESLRRANGGYASDPLFIPHSNTNSVVWAIHAHAAMGLQVPPDTWNWLLARQTSDGGFAWRSIEEGPDLMATLEAIPVLAGAYQHEWPQRDPRARVLAPHSPVAGQPMVLGLDGGPFHRVSWWSGDSWSGEGAAVQHPAESGTLVVHVEAVGDGIHFRDHVLLHVPEPPAEPLEEPEQDPDPSDRLVDARVLAALGALASIAVALWLRRRP